MGELTKETKRRICEEGLQVCGGEKLIHWLEENGYYEKPGALKHHSNHLGGLFDHSLQVAYELALMTDRLGLTWERPESPMIVGLLHDICKIDDYNIVQNAERIEFEWNKSRSYPGHGEKSLIMLMGIADLTGEEKMCIMYHEGAFTEKTDWEFYSRAIKKYPNVLYTHTADMIAAQVKGV